MHADHGWHIADRADRMSIAAAGLQLRPPDGSSRAEECGMDAAVYLLLDDPREDPDGLWEVGPDDDVWTVDLRDLELEDAPGGLGLAVLCRTAVAPERLQR